MEEFPNVKAIDQKVTSSQMCLEPPDAATMKFEVR